MSDSRSELARRGPILLLILLYLALGTRFLKSVPAWEAPDEPWHLVYAEALADGRLPTAEETYEQHHPPLYYLWPALALRATGTGPIARSPDNPRFPFAAAAYLHPPAEPGHGPLRLLRAFSGLLGSLLIALTWAFGRRALPQTRAPALAAAATVAFWPQLQSIAQAVSNDLLSAVLGAWLAYWMLRLARQDREDRGPAGALRLALALGMGWSLALLCKLNLILLVPALPLCLLLAAWTSRRPSSRGSGLRWPLLSALLCLLLPALVWLGLVAWLPGVSEALAAQLGGRGLDFQPELAQPKRVAEAALLMLDHAWGRPGWFNIDLPLGARRVASLLALLALTGLLAAWKYSDRSGRKAILLAGALSALALAAAIRNLMSDPQAQARLMFPSIGAFAWLMAVGASGWQSGPGKMGRGARSHPVDRPKRYLSVIRQSARQALRSLPWLLPAALFALSLYTTESLLPRAFSPEARAPLAPVDIRVIAPGWELEELRMDDPGWGHVLSFAPRTDGLARIEFPVLVAAGEGRIELRLFRSSEPADAPVPLAESSAALKELGRPDIGRPRIGPLADATWIGLDVPNATIAAGEPLLLTIDVFGEGRALLPTYADRSTYADGDFMVGTLPIGDLVFVTYGRTSTPLPASIAAP